MEVPINIEKKDNQIIIYQSDDGKAKLEVKLQEDTIWLSLNQISEIFDRDKSVISRHIKNIYKFVHLMATPLKEVVCVENLLKNIDY